MKTLPERPVPLLLLTGTFIGLGFPLGKVAAQAGVSPVLWAALLSLGAFLFSAGIMVFQAAAGRGSGLGEIRFCRQALFYAAGAGLISFVVPNLLLFAAIPHVGAGYMGLMFALSPVCTAVLALMNGFALPPRLERIGIVTGLLGAVVIALSRMIAETGSPDVLWLLLAFLVPCSLAAGNVFRSRFWPAEAKPDQLALGSHGFALLAFSVILFLQGDPGNFQLLKNVPYATGLQLFCAGLTFAFFFRLQRVGGPVLLSQIGYVAAGTGLLISTVFLGESYPVLTWTGAGIVALGVVFTLRSRWEEGKLSHRFRQQ
ncbi:DMT family transporter [Kiloniella sp. b19]|uniref:DMT family transporter n=1 Tax=Kiloniella sp. GXU_MW_B19 TaxID=3141326 RepID=UPI0031D76574